MLLLNVASNRILREGDRVHVTHGAQKGRYGQVVGYDLTEADRPVVVQFTVTSGDLRENLGANDLDVLKEPVTEAPEVLEPLPQIQATLTESLLADSFSTCGRCVCMTLKEDGTTLTFVPRDDRSNLREVFEQNEVFEEAVASLLEVAFVTRRPHLVAIGKSKQIGQLLTVPADDALNTLIGGQSRP